VSRSEVDSQIEIRRYRNKIRYLKEGSRRNGTEQVVKDDAKTSGKRYLIFDERGGVEKIPKLWKHMIEELLFVAKSVLMRQMKPIGLGLSL